MRKLVIILLIIVIELSINSLIFAQQCGPNCPICLGSGLNTESMLSKGTVLGNVLVVPNGEETFIPITSSKQKI